MKISTKTTSALLCLVLLCAFLITADANAQSADESQHKQAELKLTIVSESSVWILEGPAVVTITIKNVADRDLELSDGLSFRLISGKDEDLEYYAPYSLTKTYLSYLGGCQDNIQEGSLRIYFANGMMIRPEPGSQYVSNPLILNKQDSMTLRLNLTDFCWGPSGSSMSPQSPLHRFVEPGDYNLTFNFMEQRSNAAEISVESNDKRSEDQ